MTAQLTLSPRDLDILTFLYHSAGATLDLRYDRARNNRVMALAAQRLVKLTETDDPNKLLAHLYPAGCRVLGLSEHTYKTKVRRRAHPVIMWERRRREALLEVPCHDRACWALAQMSGVTVLRAHRVERRVAPVSEPVTVTSSHVVVRVAKTNAVNMASTILNVTLTLLQGNPAVSADQVHSHLAELVPVSHRVSYTRAYLRDWVRKGYLTEAVRDQFVGTGKLD